MKGHVDNKLYNRAKKLQKDYRERGVVKSVMDCVIELRMKDSMNPFGKKGFEGWMG